MKQQVDKTSATRIWFPSIDAYHETFPEQVRSILQRLRETIRLSVPEVIETISYNMPTFRQYRNLVHYAACKNHIGFYPTSSPIKAFSAELENYSISKGAIRFPIDKPLPVSLIKRIVRFRASEDAAHAKKKAGIKQQAATKSN